MKVSWRICRTRIGEDRLLDARSQPTVLDSGLPPTSNIGYRPEFPRTPLLGNWVNRAALLTVRSEVRMAAVRPKRWSSLAHSPHSSVTQRIIRTFFDGPTQVLVDHLYGYRAFSNCGRHTLHRAMPDVAGCEYAR